MLYTTACVYGGPSNTLDDCANVNAGFTGGQVAAPVVKEIVKKIAPILNIHPVVTDLPKIEQSLKLEILSNKVRLTNASL